MCHLNNVYICHLNYIHIHIYMSWTQYIRVTNSLCSYTYMCRETHYIVIYIYVSRTHHIVIYVCVTNSLYSYIYMCRELNIWAGSSTVDQTRGNQQNAFRYTSICIPYICKNAFRYTYICKNAFRDTSVCIQMYHTSVCIPYIFGIQMPLRHPGKNVW